MLVLLCFTILLFSFSLFWGHVLPQHNRLARFLCMLSVYSSAHLHTDLKTGCVVVVSLLQLFEMSCVPGAETVHNFVSRSKVSLNPILQCQFNIQDSFPLPGFTFPDIGNCDEQLHEAGYQFAKLTQGVSCAFT